MGQTGKYLCKVVSWSCGWRSLKVKVLNLVPCHHIYFLPLLMMMCFNLLQRKNVNY